MKIAWLVYDDNDDDGTIYYKPEFFTTEPPSWAGVRVVQIVYAIIEA